ncbi:alpha/beta hydrolase (plasmid) [Rhizobium sp. T1470]|uniref:alpha/beta fold hydrolase n=1 Tax=unclassified Rhizobium TaxID=2613769 RepID=UPI001AAF052D|nr:alpha/beta hydrolase [Rhizobium sp. T1473]MCA0806853.1 alpha/beta hydrolase [Rhizobium sp. T1473]
MEQVRGHPEILPGFRWYDIPLEDCSIRTAIGGYGPPLLLLHGHPQTHLTWHKVAPVLAKKFTVIAPDLRGYGDSSKPDGGPGHINYSKRTMALDQIQVMKALGFGHFSIVGHDRGARVAHRMALDHPDAVDSLALLDIAPTATMYARTDMEFARRYFWWFFLIQPYPCPSALSQVIRISFSISISKDRFKNSDAVDPLVLQEYRRCFANPATRHAICEDYRAAASIDLIHDAIDKDKRIQVPLLILWGAKGTVGALYDVLETWADKAIDVRGHAIDCGHSPQEEAPDQLLNALKSFL